MKIRMAVWAIGAGLLAAKTAMRADETPATKQEAPPKSMEERMSEVEKELREAKELKANDLGTLHAYFKEGLNLDTADGKFKLKIGLRIQNDWAWFSEQDSLKNAILTKGKPGLIGESEDGTEFRRARIYMSGVVYDYFEYKAEYEFAATNPNAHFKDVYIGVRKIPVIGNLRVGHFKEPFSMEENTSDNDGILMERSVADAFAPSRNFGAMIFDSELDNRTTWAIGVFRDDLGGDDNLGVNQANGRYSGAARLTGLPIYEDDGETLVHLGVAYAFRDPTTELARYRRQPDAHLAKNYVDTGAFAANNVHQLGFEAAAQYKSAIVQAEFVGAKANGKNSLGDPEFYGLYVQGSYAITGEHHNYRRDPRMYDRTGVFDRIRPNESLFNGKGGFGALEVATRYGFIDLNSDGIGGGKLHVVTSGINWILNPNYEVQWDYVFAHREAAGDGHIVEMRFQAAF